MNVQCLRGKSETSHAMMIIISKFPTLVRNDTVSTVQLNVFRSLESESSLRALPELSRMNVSCAQAQAHAVTSKFNIHDYLRRSHVACELHADSFVQRQSVSVHPFTCFQVVLASQTLQFHINSQK